MCRSDKVFLDEFFARLRATERPEECKDSLRFLHEFLSLAKDLPPDSRSQLYKVCLACQEH